MGDPSTHLIFYQAYWYLVFLEHHLDGTWWIDKTTMHAVCPDGLEEKKFELKRIQS